MKKTASVRRLLCLLLTLVLALGLLPAGVLAVGTNEVTVTFSYAKENTFVMPPQALTVAAGTAFEYGISKKASTTPTLLDAVVAAHIQKYGEAFTAETASTYVNSSLTKLFGDSGYGGHIINGHYSSNYGEQQTLAQGDLVEVFLYDSSYGDYYAAFYQGNEQVRALAAETFTGLSLTVKGFCVMGAYYGETWEVLPALHVGYIAEDGSFTDLHVDTGSDGTCTVRFDSAGTYLLATQGPSDSKPVVPAWCKVTVTGGLSEEEQQAAVSSDKEALNIVYTDGQNLTLPTQGNSGKTSISWTSDNEAVISKTGAVSKQVQAMQVKLTATIRCGEASAEKAFNITVPALTGEEITQRLADAKSALNVVSALDPVEYSGGSGGMYAYESEAVDVNIVTKAQGIVDKAAPGVTVVLDNSFHGNEYITAAGKIVYPNGYSNGTVNDLPFVLSMGGKSETVSVSGITIPTHDTTKEEAVQELMAEVTENVVLNGQAKEHVTSTLKLPVGSSYGLGITWSSDHTAVTITRGTSSSTGQLHTITRPVCGEEDAVVTLTATFDYTDMAKTYGMCDAGPMPEGNTKTFTFTVPAVTAEEAVAVREELTAALETITADRITAYDKTNTSDTKVPADLNAVMSDLHLYDLGWDRENPYYRKGIDVSWSTTNQAVVVNTLRAKVTRPVGTADAAGELKVTLSKLGVSVDKTFTITVKAVSAEEVMHNIAAKYAESGIAGDSNLPWLAADMAAYAKAFPGTENVLTEAQTQAALDAIISLAAETAKPSDLAKYIIALRALGYDARQVCTAQLEQLDLVEKLTAMVDAQGSSVKNVYTLPYVLIALQQGEGYMTKAQEDWMIQTLLDSEASWVNTRWGTDAMTPVLLALAPYYSSNEAVKAAVDRGFAALEKAQADNGSVGSNAASTGLAMAACAALGRTGPVKDGKSLTDGLMTQVADSLDGFEPTTNTFSTEQGFRGLVAQVLQGRIFDFAANPMAAAQASWAQNCPVSFQVVPEDADIQVKLGSAVQQAKSPGKYDLAAGEYSYSVSKDGYVTVTGTFTVTAEEAAAHTEKSFSLSLVTQPGESAKDIQVSVQVLSHDGTVCGGKLSYKNNASAYTVELAKADLQMKAGQTVFDALAAALAQADVSYVEKTYGYISKIGSDVEFGHDSPRSGWMYLVNGASATVGCRDYVLSGDAQIVWFFTDDYAVEYGSENWTEAEKPQDLPFTDVNGHWALAGIRYVYENKIFQGVSDTLFDPDGTMDRAMLVTALYRLAGSPSVHGQTSFTDVKDDDTWYTTAIAWAAETGLVDGYGDGTFGPEDEITREQMAAVLYRYARYKGYDVSQAGMALREYADYGEISGWALESLAWANAAGLVTGRTASTIVPQGLSTRAEVATLIMRFMQLYNLKNPAA